MRCAVILAVFVLLPAVGMSATWYVPDHFPTIQDAISDPLVVDGDTIIVRPGKYVENIDFLGKNISLTSEFGPRVTGIDGNRSGAVINIINGEGPSTLISGFTITNGKSSWAGGINCRDYSSPTIRNNIISANDGDKGGGILCYQHCSAHIADNEISNNTATYGGGIYCQHSSVAVIENNTILNNTARKDGGGIWAMDYCNNQINDNIISGNTSQFGDGGGIFNDHTWPHIRRNLIIGNTAAYNGGGFYNENSSQLHSNIFTGNKATHGGAIWCHLQTTVQSCILTGNRANFSGGGIYTHHSENIINSTIVANSAGSAAGGIDAHGGPKIISTIIRDNTASHYTQIRGSPTVTYSNIQGGWTGTGNINTDPLFVDSTNNDFHLTLDSPCKDTGDNSAATELYDFEGDPRIHDGIVDMGADEYHLHLYHTGDIVPGGTCRVGVVGLPGDPVILVYGQGGVQDPPQTTQFGNLFLLPPYYHGRSKPIPTNGVRIISRAIPPSLAQNTYAFQALVGPLTGPAELTNLMVLTVD